LASPYCGTIDLHVHTNHSDGLKSATEMIRIAAERGLAAVAITDHDGTSALAEAQEAGAKWKVEIIPGIEISAYYQGYETHILGYYIDPHFLPLENFAKKFRLHRAERAKEILRKLNQQGIHIPFELLQARANGSCIGRPHIADLLVEEGFVFSFQEAFSKYLAEKRPAYVAKLRFEAEQAIQLIQQAGGLAFLAHPAVGVPDEVIQQLARQGLDGLETLHPKHHPDQVAHYQELVRQFGMVETGGSDCHGGRMGESMLGYMMVPYAFLEKMKSRLQPSIAPARRTGSTL